MSAPGSNVVLPHMRLTWGGDLGSPAVEIWSNGLAFQPVLATPTAAQLLQFATDAATGLKSWVTRNSSFISQAVRLRWVKAVYVEASGRQRDTNTAVYDFPNADIAQGAMTAPTIWEQTYAITLRSALQRGPGHAGRIFPPVAGPGPQTADTPYASEGAAISMGTSFATLLGELTVAGTGAIGGNNLNGVKAVPVIVSRVTNTNPTPKLTPITRIAVDRVPDVQHRRVNRVGRNEAPTIVLP